MVVLKGGLPFGTGSSPTVADLGFNWDMGRASKSPRRASISPILGEPPAFRVMGFDGKSLVTSVRSVGFFVSLLERVLSRSFVSIDPGGDVLGPL